VNGKVIPIRRDSPPMAAQEPELTDAALVAACAVGDSTALGVLFDRHHRGVYVFLSRLRGTDERDLDDLVQATFLEALRAAPRYRGDAPVHRWLFGIASFVASHHVRAEIKRKSFALELADVPRRKPTDPGDIVEREQLIAHVRRAVDALPAKQRTVYVMCELEGVSGVDAAKVLGLREGTVWRLLYQARVALRASLAEENP